MSIEHTPSTMHEGPHLSIDIGDGYEREPIHLYNTLADQLDLLELIQELQDGYTWLRQQDPDERVYGPPEPPSAALVRLREIYEPMVKHSLEVMSLYSEYSPYYPKETP